MSNNTKNNHNFSHTFFDVIKKPIITEKSTVISENGYYVFSVDIKSTKHMIKKAIEHIFNVKVQSVNSIVKKGKNKRFRGKLGTQNNIKKALVKLEKNYKIDLTIGI